MQRRWLVGFVTAAVVTASCSGSDASDTAESTAETTVGAETITSEPITSEPITSEPATTASDGNGNAAAEDDGVDAEDEPGDRGSIDATVRPGVEQLAIVDAAPGLEVTVLAGEEAVATATTDAYGSLLFRGLAAEADYDIETADSFDGPLTVLDRESHPDPAFYAEQRLVAPGFGYIEMRDGTTLSANVVLPGPVEEGPYPTVVEYSGYTPSDPEAAGLKDLWPALGYAYVGVNMRGSGCSGGSFRFFEYAQSLDGYDVIEAVAAQPWALGHRVGMVGVSYPGISQLFVAQTQPPSLAAITPLSVLDDSYNSTLYPGGILNTGFAVNWTQGRLDDGRPAIDPDGNPTGEGQEWAGLRIASGDETCATNQELRLQNPDLVQQIVDTPYYDPALGDEISPQLFVDQIEVPTFIAGAWQDEQTGGRFPAMLDRFTGTDHLYATMLNGLHTESISPAVFPRYIEFLDLYVAERTPSFDAAQVIAPILAGGLYGTTDFTLPPDRFAGLAYADALAAFEAEPPIQVMFEQGAADGFAPLTPLPRFVESFESWPIATTEAREWHLGEEGRLTETPNTTAATTSYLALPDGIPATFWDGNSSDLWRTDVEWDWREPAPGTVSSFLSDPLTATAVMAGSGSADLWVASNLGDTDLEVTLSEVRPDGGEVYVQSGWLRASHRALDEASSTALRPVHTHLESDAAPLTDGGADPADPDLELVRVELFPFAHVFRAGSRIRISIDAPGGNRATWEFATISGGEEVTIGLGGEHGSRVVLPLLTGVAAPAEYPDCASLRGQPCREFSSTGT